MMPMASLADRQARELGKPVALRGVMAGGKLREEGPGHLRGFLDHHPDDFGLPLFAQ
jgi:hypothetical protein